jgi:hypothetical protein
MTVKEYQRLFRVKFKPEVEFAMQYLEDRGHRFAEDFGYTNAIPLATTAILRDLAFEEYGHGV